MPRDPKLTVEIKQKLSILEPDLKRCVKTGDFEKAKDVMHRIQKLLLVGGYNSRLMQNKNYFYETAIEIGKINYAISGLTGVRNKVSDSSRIYLESTALLSICHIRNKDYKVAENFIRQTIRNINNIKSDKLRISFYNSYLSRVDEEILISKISGCFNDNKDVDLIHKESIKLIRTNNVDEIYETIGRIIPNDTINLLNSFQKNNLLLISSADRKLLPQPISIKQKEKLGKKFSAAIKRVVWKGLCDENSDLYRCWSQGLSIVHDKKYISTAIMTALWNHKISSTMLAASIVALAVRFGVGIFCELFEPGTIMEKRIK